MFRLWFSVWVFTSCLATAARAQAATSSPLDPVFARAQALVSDGNGAAGRALVDSMLAATPPNAPLYPQALFWRASLASNAAEAETDYKHIVVDYALAPQAEDALLRLAQLELARGDRDAALAHLQRIPRDYPRSKSLARANYWTARVLFEKGDVASACVANSNALAQASADEVELRNQIQYQGQRCPAARVEAVSAKAPQVDTVSSVGVGVQAVSGIENPASAASSPVASTASEAGTIPGSELKSGTAAKPDLKSSVDARDERRVTVEPGKPASSAGESHSAKTSSRTPTYSVQIAAYNHKTDAEKLAAGLLKRGYQARVDGDIIPFRVRIGRYSTAVDAEDALKKMKARHMDGFVVRAPDR